MATNIGNPGKRIRITRKERKTGQIDKDKIPVQKKVVIELNKKPKAEKSTMEFRRGGEKTTYTKSDVRTGDKAYGKESSTKPTPEFIKKAQAAKVDVVHKDGLSYRAGHTKTEKKKDTHHVKIKVTPHLKMVKSVPNTGSDTTKGMDEIRQKNGSGPKRRLERVSWLKGRNKRTESGHG